MNQPSASTERIEKNEFGLTPEQVRSGLIGLKNKTFPIKLLTLRYQDQHNNGFKDYEEICKDSSYSLLLEDQKSTLQKLYKNPEAEKVLKKIQTIKDFGCGDGITLYEFLSTNNIKPTYLYLYDTSGIAVQQAKNHLQRQAYSTIGEVKDYMTEPMIKTESNSLATYLGFSIGNRTKGETYEFRQHALSSCTYSLITFRHSQSDTTKKARVLNAYQGDVNIEQENKQMKQMKNMLSALGFTDEDIKNCLFKAQYEETNTDNQPLNAGFIPQVTITIDGIDYIQGEFYPILASNALGKEYIDTTIDNRSSGGDKIIATERGEYTTAILIEHNAKEKEEKIKDKRLWTTIYASTLVALLAMGYGYIKVQEKVELQKNQNIKEIMLSLGISPTETNEKTQKLYDALFVLNHSNMPASFNDVKFNDRNNTYGKPSLQSFIINQHLRGINLSFDKLLITYLREQQFILQQNISGDNMIDIKQVFDNPVLDYLQPGSKFEEAINNTADNLYKLSEQDIQAMYRSNQTNQYDYSFFNQSGERNSFKVFTYQGKRYAIRNYRNIEQSRELAQFTRSFLQEMQKTVPYLVQGASRGSGRANLEDHNKQIEQSLETSIVGFH